MPDTVIPPQIPTTPVTDEVLAELRAIVGDKGLLIDEQDKEPFINDWRRTRSGSAAVVVRPATVEETSKVVKLCYDKGIAMKVVPQAYCQRADALEAMQRIDEAWASYEKELARDPDSECALYGYFQANHQIGPAPGNRIVRVN